MKDAGFDISVKKDGTNPVHEARYTSDSPGLMLFSKTYDDAFNPKNDFAAIMTYSCR